MKWDLLIRNGTLVDPAHSVHARRDVAFAGRSRAPRGSSTSPAPVLTFAGERHAVPVVGAGVGTSAGRGNRSAAP